MERKPSLKHSVSKDDEKMKVNEFITDRSTIAVEELKQDVIKANEIKLVESKETKKIVQTTNNEFRSTIPIPTPECVVWI